MNVDVRYEFAAARIEFKTFYSMCDKQEELIFDSAVLARASLIFAFRSEATLRSDTPDSIRKHTIDIEKTFVEVKSLVHKTVTYRRLPRLEQEYINENLFTIDVDGSRKAFW